MAEDIKGLPDVDLSPIIEDLDNQDKDQEKEAKKEVKKEVSEDLAQFKSPQDLLKSYKELQGAFTKTSQQNKELEAKINELQEQIELSRNSQVFQPGVQPQEGDSFWDNPEAAVQQITLTQRIAEVLEEEQDKKPDEFQERYAFAQRVISQYPQLAKTVGGVRKAFQYGDKLRSQSLKESTGKALEALFGEPLNEEEMDRLRKLVKGDKRFKENKPNNNAYMPDTETTNLKTQNQNQKADAETKIKTHVEQGNVDGVLGEMFNSLMAE